MSEIDEIADNLWAKSLDGDKTATNDNILLEQYKLYVSGADKISDRRHNANTFFLSFNTALIGALAGFYRFIKDTGLTDAFFVGALALCCAWALLLRSYRNLNTAKFKVIGAMEEKLSASPYWRAEWSALGYGKDYKKYIPLTVVETLAPAVFFALYAYLLFR